MQAPGRLVSVTRTATELSIVAPSAVVPATVPAERDFRVIEVVGPVPFSVVGLMAAITRPLAEAGVSVFTLATYDTDYVLVREPSLDYPVDEFFPSEPTAGITAMAFQRSVP